MKKILASLLTLTITLTAQAETICNPPSGFTKISTPSEFMLMENNKNYFLCEDLDFHEITNYQPLFANACRSSISNGFQGVFEGNNKTISNLTYTNITSNSKNSACAGIFGVVGPTGHVKNLYLRNVQISAITSVGGLVGRNYGRITNARGVDLSIKGGSRVGEMVGWNLGRIESTSFLSNLALSARTYWSRVMGTVHIVYPAIASTTAVVETRTIK